jgi:hypothetical protein
MTNKLTEVQTNLLNKVKLYIGKNSPMAYDRLKILCEFKSFDSTFNVLLNKGYVKNHKTNDFTNQFKL